MTGQRLIQKLPQKLIKTPFSYRQAVAAGLTKYTLKKMILEGTVEKLGRGIYQKSDEDSSLGENRYQAAAIRCGFPSSICLLSALEHYHVTDQIPKQTWVLVPESKRVSSRDLKLIRSRNPQWNVGIRKTKHYWITTLERTLIEGLLHKKRLGSQVAIAAIKQAVAQKKVKLGDLYDMAKKMEVEHRIRSTIEALSS